MARDIAYGSSSFIYLPKLYQLVLQMTDLSMFKTGTNGVNKYLSIVLSCAVLCCPKSGMSACTTLTQFNILSL